MDRSRRASLAAATAALGVVTAFSVAGSAGAQGTKIPNCNAINNVQAIIDDSGSMSSTDPNELRRTGMEIFITNSVNLGKTLGVVEFGSTANTIFAPQAIRQASGSDRGTISNMIAALRAQIDANNGGTDYNSGFIKAGQDNRNAQARIFLTDGADNGGFSDTHRGGPRTFVVGLGIGPASPSDPDATRLQQIANETGGRYFPSVTKTTLQSTFNAISGAVSCLQPPRQFASKLFVRPGQTSGRTTGVLAAAKKLDFLVNWAEPGNRFGISKITALGRKGKKLATLSGKGKPKRLRVTTARGDTFQSLTVRKPKGTKKIAFRVKALKVTTAERTITELSQRR